MTERMRRAWAWLLARSEPRRPPRRIVTIAWFVCAVAVAITLSNVPPEPTLRVVRVITAATIGVGLIVIVYVIWSARRTR